MREDLAEWMNTLYPELRINVDNFMDRLDTGVALQGTLHISSIFCVIDGVDDDHTKPLLVTQLITVKWLACLH